LKGFWAAFVNTAFIMSREPAPILGDYALRKAATIIPSCRNPVAAISVAEMERETTMKTLILATVLGLSTLMLAGCVSEGVSYEDNGYNEYNSRPRDYSERYNRNERWRDRTDYSGDREYGRRDRGNDEGRTDRRERESRRGNDRRCSNDPRCEVPEYNPERPGYYRRGEQAQGY
jgi:hypothetical protein